MNIQLLEEIEDLKRQEIPISDIATLIGISRANILLMLRIKTVVESSVGSKLENLQKENQTLKDQLEHLKEKLPKIDNIDVIIQQNEEIPLLKEKIEDLRYTLEDLQFKNSLLESKFNNVPNFIKRIFCE